MSASLATNDSEKTDSVRLENGAEAHRKRDRLTISVPSLTIEFNMKTPADSMHVYEVRPRKDQRGVDLISDALPFRHLWYVEPNAISNAVGYAKFRSRSHDAVIRVYDEAGNVIETHE